MPTSKIILGCIGLFPAFAQADSPFETDSGPRLSVALTGIFGEYQGSPAGGWVTELSTRFDWIKVGAEVTAVGAREVEDPFDGVIRLVPVTFFVGAEYDFNESFYVVSTVGIGFAYTDGEGNVNFRRIDDSEVVLAASIDVGGGWRFAEDWSLYAGFSADYIDGPTYDGIDVGSDYLLGGELGLTYTF